MLYTFTKTKFEKGNNNFCYNIDNTVLKKPHYISFTKMFCSDVIDHRIYKLLVTFYKIHFLYTVIHFCII